MGTTLIKSRKRGYDPDKLPDQERTFVLALMGDHEFKPVNAARAAKYKNPSVAACKLMSRPRVLAALGKAMQEREERCQLKADDVLNYLRVALFFNPLRYFKPGEDGKWVAVDMTEIPEEVGRLIESVKIKNLHDKDGNVTESYFEIELVSKATALSLAMKHTTVEKHAVEHTLRSAPDWDDLTRAVEGDDPVEQRIKEEEGNGQG